MQKSTLLACTFLCASALITIATLHAAARPVWSEHEHQEDHERQQDYKFVPLHAPFAGVDQTLGYGVNDFGVVVGVYHDPAGPHGFVLDDGTYTPINVTANGVVENTSAFGINLRRDIVGSYGAAGASHGFLFQDGVFTMIDFPAANVIQTDARGINDRGQIVGTYYDSAGSHGFLYQQTRHNERGDAKEQGEDHEKKQAKYTAINVPFSGATNTVVLGINDRCEIVGSYFGSDGRPHGFVREHEEFHTLDVPFQGVVETQAYGINNRREIVGTGFLLEHRVFTPLPDLSPSAAGALGTGINDRGEIVGIAGSSPETGFILIPQ